MEPWFAALARPTAAVPSAVAHNNALAWRISRAGAVWERASPPAQPAAHPSSPKPQLGDESTPDLESDPADLDWEHPIARVQFGHALLERVFFARGIAQDRDRAAISARSIDLPPNRPVRCRQLDHPACVHSH